MAEMKTGAEIVWECLLREGVEVVFGYPGGAILPTYDALSKYKGRIKHVLVRHEQGATHMADGYARASGKVGVAMATSGPGATNMVTGIATAMMDSSPIVCITGQVPTGAIGGDAFQETDMTGVTLPITKHNYLVTHIEDLAQTIREAFYIARTGRPGPVLIDIPKDVQNASIEFVYPTEPIDLLGYHPPAKASDEHVAEALALINSAERPVILAGHGVLISGAMQELRELAEKGNIPVTTTLLGIGSLPASHPMNMGMMGMHGGSWPNNAIQEADLLIACGMRFDDRVTGNLKTYSPKSKKIHIEIDASEINKNVKVDVGINADLGTVLRQINPGVKRVDRSAWFGKIKDWEEDSNERDILQFESPTLLAAQAIRKIWEGTNGAAFVVTDVGQHQMLECQYYSHDDPFTLSTSGGAGTMGFSVPAAIGASFHVKDREIWVIVGDGCIQMTIMELATAVQENANINICIINNGYLGMVRQWQQMFYESRYMETPIYSPDYVKLAEAYRMPGYRVEKLEEILPTMRQAQEHKGPVLIEFVVEQFDNVYPMVPAGADLHDMIRRPHPRFENMEIV
ncbi:MAG: biosynthetic-type acetolactate synthase large subunit [Anaerolineaceae bacterium]|nr:biosynthetic-type acetolactate synthase large subunit [Anaerolineaceae bacterium]MCB9099555.1 biosynthetic-type acetolactate synthase large subunit [Anaerolineales bacterium]